jgi:hypothetical protein
MKVLSINGLPSPRVGNNLLHRVFWALPNAITVRRVGRREPVLGIGRQGQEWKRRTGVAPLTVASPLILNLDFQSLVPDGGRQLESCPDFPRVSRRARYENGRFFGDEQNYDTVHLVTIQPQFLNRRGAFRQLASRRSLMVETDLETLVCKPKERNWEGHLGVRSTEIQAGEPAVLMIQPFGRE